MSRTEANKNKYHTITGLAESIIMNIKSPHGWTWAFNEQNLGALESKLEKLKKNITPEDHSILATDVAVIKQQRGEETLAKMMLHFNMVEESLGDLSFFCTGLLNMQKAWGGSDQTRKAPKKVRTSSHESL